MIILSYLVIDKLPNAVELVLQNIDRELDDSIKRATVITLLIRQCYKVDNDLEAPLFIIRTRLATITNDELDKHKIFLVCNLQYKKNLEYVNAIVCACKKNSKY